MCRSGVDRRCLTAHCFCTGNRPDAHRHPRWARYRRRDHPRAALEADFVGAPNGSHLRRPQPERHVLQRPVDKQARQGLDRTQGLPRGGVSPFALGVSSAFGDLRRRNGVTNWF